MSPGPTGLPLVVVDAANVVGSVPDRWWRDRVGATTRLRDALAGLGERGLEATGAPVQVLMVLEGAARDVPPSPTVDVVAAVGSGDDEVVAVVRAALPRPTWVVTADRGLRARVEHLGAAVVGPRAVR